MLFVSGVGLSPGCVYVPVPERPPAGSVDPRRVVGGPSSPIHLGATTCEQVLEVLGPPFARSSDGRFMAYHATNEIGYWIDPIWGSNPNSRSYFLLLEFDGDGVVRRHAVARERFAGGVDDGTSLQRPWRQFAGDVSYREDWNRYGYGLEFRRRRNREQSPQ